ncbi:hypothetical protein [Tolypothrix tenuis]
MKNSTHKGMEFLGMGHGAWGMGMGMGMGMEIHPQGDGVSLRFQ